MPELPEVETLRRTLTPRLIGRRIVNARLARPDVCVSAGARGARRSTARDLLKGGVVCSVERHGKQLALAADDGRTLCVHLGMSGQLRVLEGDGEPAHVHARWALDDGGVLIFRDPRRFGGLWTFPSGPMLRAARWGALGVDAMGAGAADLARACAGRRAIKAALMDQRTIAGLGNIYADEALFEARLLPTREAGSIEGPERERLARAIGRVLERAIRRGGSTLRDYVDGSGRAGRAQEAHAVYGRAGQPCTRCGRSLLSTRIAQRTTVFCAACQG